MLTGSEAVVHALGHAAEPITEQRDGQAAEAPPRQQQKSRVVRPGEKRTKKGKRRINSGGPPPPLPPEDFVKIQAISKRSEVSKT